MSDGGKKADFPLMDTATTADASVRGGRPGESEKDRGPLSTMLASLGKKLRLRYQTKIRPFWKITVAQIACVVYVLVLTFSPMPVGLKDPATGDIIDPASEENTEAGVIYVNGSHRPVIAVGGWQKFCLAMSRMSAFSLYPVIVSVFISKMKALQSFFSNTPLSIFLGILEEGHEHHSRAGAYIAFDVWIHTLFHLLRWESQGNIQLLWKSNAGLSGLIAVVSTPLIAFPMMYFKKKIRYEIRKALHCLFYVFAVALCFHVPITAIPNGGFLTPILGTCIVVYTLDAIYVFLFMSERIRTTAFHVLSSGVRISMPVSDQFRKRLDGLGSGGYAYICIPWVNKWQWHAFSLFEDPNDPRTQQMFLLKCGDWTDDVHNALTRNTTRPCWIKGPFPSPYTRAVKYDNQILVASGIGITPALASINAFKGSKRVNLIWACRDPEMLEFFLENMYLDHDGWTLIYYTGKQRLKKSIESANTNIKVIKGRPQLASVIPNIIYGIESGTGLPEKFTQKTKTEVKKGLVEFMSQVNKDSDKRAGRRLFELHHYAESYGFSLQQLVDEESSSKRKVEDFDIESPGAEEEAQNLLEELEESLCQSVNITQSIISQPADFSEIVEQEKSPSLRNRRGCHRLSMEQWITMRRLVSDGDSNSLLNPAYRPWEKDESQEKSVKRLSHYVTGTWGIMYCGGSQPVIEALQEVSIEYDLHLQIDSFAW